MKQRSAGNVINISALIVNNAGVMPQVKMSKDGARFILGIILLLIGFGYMGTLIGFPVSLSSFALTWVINTVVIITFLLIGSGLIALIYTAFKGEE